MAPKLEKCHSGALKPIILTVSNFWNPMDSRALENVVAVLWYSDQVHVVHSVSSALVP